MFSKFKWFILILLVANKVLAVPLLAGGRQVELVQSAAKDKSKDQTNTVTTELADDKDSKDDDEEVDATKGSSESKSKSDTSQTDSKSDDTSEENEDSGSNSNPDTEEEGDSDSLSNTTEENDGKSDSDEEKESEEEKSSASSNSNTTENDKDESEDTSESSSSESEDLDDGDDKNKLLVILLDGVRPDYITRDEKKLKAFTEIKATGVYAKYVKPVFPANSLPNYYSIATGKYPDKHGIINNYMYDKRKKDIFTGVSDPKEKHWWDKAEPIWTTAKKQKKKVHVSWWMGCEVEINKRRPSSCEPYRDLTDNPNYNSVVTDRLKQIVSSFAKDDYDMAMVYYENVDAIGHKHGPNSRKTVKAVREVDNILVELMEEIEEQGLSEKVNVVIISDHGMTTSTKTINLEKYVDFNDIDKVVGDGAFAMIAPEKRKVDSVYDQLRQASVRGLNVYKKDKLPTRMHLKKGELVLPIVLTADEGYVINTPEIKNKVYPGGEPQEQEGHHGYDPDHVDEMNAIFYAFGPDFRDGYEAEPMRQVDHYNLFCHLIGIKAKPNDGVWGRVQRVLKSEESVESSEETKESDEDDDDNGAQTVALSTLLVIVVSLNIVFSY